MKGSKEKDRLINDSILSSQLLQEIEASLSTIKSKTDAQNDLTKKKYKVSPEMRGVRTRSVFTI